MENIRLPVGGVIKNRGKTQQKNNFSYGKRKI